MAEMRLITKEEAKLSTLLEKVYPSALIQATEQAIITKINSIRQVSGVQQRKALSEKSIMFICYADTFTREGQMPLVTLKHKADRYLKPTIDTIHILPFYPWSSDDGFAVKDLEVVKANLGSWEDISALAEGYQLMFDAVINHLSAQGTWFEAWLSGEPAFDNFFISVAPKDVERLAKVVRPRTLPLVHSFQKQAQEVLVWTTFSQDQIDLNYKNPQVLLAILDVLLGYAEKGASYIRLDAIAYLWKELDSTSIHLPQTHAIIQIIRRVLELAGQPIRIITETNVPHADNISYFGSGDDEAHPVYNFALPPLLLHTLYSGDTGALEKWAHQLDIPHPDTHFLNFTASHDGIGITPLNDLVPKAAIEAICHRVESLGGNISMKSLPGSIEVPYELNINWLDAMADPNASSPHPTLEQIDRFFLTQGLVLSLKGLPGIYSHSLFGSQGWLKGPRLTGIQRSVNREKLDADVMDEELANPNSLRSRIYSKYVSLLKIRTQEAAFAPASAQKIIASPPGCFALMRIAEADDHILCIYNFGSTQVDYLLSQTASNTVYRDLISGTIYPEQVIQLKPFSMAWLKAQ